MKTILLFLIATGFITSCAEESLEYQRQGENEGPGKMVLGEKLENPYSVKNMRAAYASLPARTRAAVDDAPVEEVIYTTHHYVKFKPKTEEELGILKSDSTLMLYPYPLDYDIIAYGEYRDPGIPDEQPTYYYASVPVDQALPDQVEWEIVEELYIPDEYSDEEEEAVTRSGKALDDAFIEDLVDKALEITGNDDPRVAVTRSRSSWRPAGFITYFDDATNRTIGLEGVKVKARRWFTTHKGYACASTGYYYCDGTFKRDANYSFDLERNDFHVKGSGVKTDFDGPKKRGNWDYSFRRSKSETEYFAATIFRAAYHYYYKEIGGLRRPPQNSFWRTQMKLKAFNENGRNNFKSARRFLGGNMIKIYTPSDGTVRLYATTIHELAHAAHWRMIVKEPGTNRHRDYHDDSNDKNKEGWARGVQYFLTRMVYPAYRGGDVLDEYTNVVVDLIDTEADAPGNNGKNATDGDNVTGYTMRQIEDALIGVNTWNKWRDNIKNKYNNETEHNLDALFAAW
ncbi:MAG: hypothetical protein LBP56_05930 [Odoribacteraceae bacterium]|jgi:hypothetical protein|nr:hypothetical protein [Odoribacteraceae bacterium]